ncbi:MAG: nucleotidyl transferase AbiEii/AbiGii toxin family protein [Candidatus Aminicenantes bacterium]
MIWEDVRERAKEEGVPVNSVVGEVLHLVVLEVLFSLPESQIICFQGGTSLHLLYGGYRYSEDLGFAGEEINAPSVKKLMDKSKFNIEKNIIQFLGRGRFRWKYPADPGRKKVFVYGLNFQPQEMRRVFRVKMEFGGYPVYRVKVIPVKSDFDIMHRRPLVNGLTPDELMAEKVTAVAGRPYLKERDIFDLWFMSEVLDQKMDISLVAKKFKDYRISWNDAEMKKKLERIESANMEAEMKRFLPQRFRHQLSRDDYAMIKHSASTVMDEAANAVSSHETHQ